MVIRIRKSTREGMNVVPEEELGCGVERESGD